MSKSSTSHSCTGEYATDEEEEMSPMFPNAIEVFDLAENEDMLSPVEMDPEKLAHKFKEELGITPLVPVWPEGLIHITGNVLPESLIHITGNVLPESLIHITGNVLPEGLIHITGNVLAEGLIHITGNVLLEGLIHITGNVLPEGLIHITGNVLPEGLIHITGNVLPESLIHITGESLHLSELRIVLLGWRYAGKSSSGNTILGREEFDLRTGAQCVKRRGEVAGRQVTVVDTPGWSRDHPVERSTELVKQEIVRSVSLCPPGPHTLLLVIGPDRSFREEERRSVEGHLQLLSERVWSHTIVLFTYGDCLGDTTIEQHIETEGKALQWLVEKCGNRYHVLNNENRGDDTQVTELLDKMEEMVAGNRGGHYEMDREILEKIEERRRAEEERAQQRLMKVQEQRETLRSLMGDSLHLSDLRIVLLGGRYAGKSSSGNTILGREEFDLMTAAQCVKRQGEVAGRQVTVVDTPGSWRNLPVEWSTELVKQEIVRSVSLCLPGPHTLLLVIGLHRSFSEEDRRSVEGHLQLLTERVWSHTIVLFTYGDCLGDTTIEQHIEREGKVLQWLVEKCGNRYHVLNNENRGDDTQVTELLDKMEEMVAGNRGGHYEMDREILEKIEERRRAEEERAQQRLMKVQEQRETLRSLMGDSLHLSELRIVLLGGRDAGKSSSGNTILGREEFDLRIAAECVKRQREVAGRQVTVVDTPGWWRNLPVELSTELVKQEIVRSVSLCPPAPHTLLLVIGPDRSFREEERRSVEGHLQLLSESVWSHTIVLFTDTTIEQHIERQGKALQWLVEKCGNRYHVLNNENRGDDTQVTELLDKMEEMVAGNRGGHYEMDREILEKIEERRRAEEERAQQRLMKVQEQRETLRSLMGDSLHLPELRIMLLGARYAGKSSSGNTILGREKFDLRTGAQCVKRRGEVAGRQVTVVDTPGWRSLPVESTTELVKQEMVRGVSLCPPGPHTLLLVIRLDLSFLEEHRRSVKGHLQLLSERVWSHTIVLFTHGDRLGDTTIEQHIEREGKALQWLVKKCGNRYHVLNNNNRGDDTQVTELLDKMEEMVAGNRANVFYQTSLLPVTRAGSYDFLYPNMSGDSRAERDYHSGWRSEAGSLLSLEEWRDGRSDLRSLSSGYGSLTSTLSHLSSESNPHRSPHTRLTPEPAHSREPQGPILTFVIPEFTSQPSETLYRLQCPHAGLFQCRLTGLAFQMEGEGEVLYKTVQWDEGLLHSTGQTPAGPLFNISCPQGSVCQLHLPHCEIPSGEGVDSLCVAHISGDNVELLPPLRVTDTHVVVNITDLSLWGLVRRFIPFLTTRGQVLPFLQPVDPLRSVLNLIVLPHNVPLLERVQVHWNYGPNYHPTFQVFLNTDTEEVELRLLERRGKGKQVWAACVPLTGSSSIGGRQTEHAQKGSAKEQLCSARLVFLERVSMPVLDDLLDGLLQERVINDAEMEAVKVEAVRKDRALVTIDMVLRKGSPSCFVMKTMLFKYDPALHKTLGFQYNMLRTVSDLG
ncbi:uncharacterized protein [Osmerus mordax]|uniref:uncharacterized protein n=1 Tax=Osmerus mordax TaxID=8014 RepID=UPI00350F35C7